ncbi:MAG: HD domain-containing protein [Thermoanaerobaculales bacterium]|nr:HD domain-containing protein [Thermoanaerobaculales bacterium]
MDRIVDFLFEVGMLKRTPRSGWHFLPGAEGESVADHVFRMTMIAWVLSRLDGNVDSDHVLELALVHDLPETRTGDLNYVHQKYTTVDEANAARAQSEGLPFGDELEGLLREYREGETPESALAHDADQLEMLLSLKERLDGGAAAAQEWVPFVLKRLRTDAARDLAARILTAHSHDWWFDRGSDWWVKAGKD